MKHRSFGVDMTHISYTLYKKKIKYLIIAMSTNVCSGVNVNLHVPKSKITGTYG